MSLRAKTLLFSLITFLVLNVVLFFTASPILQRGFATLEQENSIQNIERAQTALTNELVKMGETNRDYASWDDTYAFVEEPNPEYVEDNFNADTFANLRLNVIALATSSGEIIFEKWFDLENSVEAPRPDGVNPYLASDSPLFQHATTESLVAGLARLEAGPMMVTSRPILTSSYEGPIRGSLIMGRFLTPQEIDRLSSVTGLSLTFSDIDDPQLPGDSRIAVENLSAGEWVFVQPLDRQTYAGYTILNDVLKIPGYLLRVDNPRLIYEQALVSNRYLTLALVLVTSAFSLFILLILERQVLSRLAGLNVEVKRISGDTEHQASESMKDQLTVIGSDEISGLTQSINDMLQEKLGYARNLEHRLTQIQVVAEISRLLSAEIDQAVLLERVVDLVSTRLGFYYVGIFLVDKNQEYAILRAGSGEAGKALVAQGFKLPVGAGSMIGWAIENRKARIALDIGKEAIRFSNPRLPLTRSEIALPILIRYGTSAYDEILGAMTIQSEKPAAFDQEDITVLQGIADSLANAIVNARLFAEIQASLEEIQALHHQYLEHAWSDVMEFSKELDYTYEPEVASARSAASQDSPSPSRSLQVALKLRDQVIGYLTLEAEEQDGDDGWTSEELALIKTVADQAALALENARLLEEMQRRAKNERLAASLAGRVWASTDIDTILRTTLRELGRSLQVSEGLIQIDLQPGGQLEFYE